MMQMPENFKAKSFWEKKEGTTGMLFGLPLLAAIGYGLYKLLPYIITLMKNTITAVALGAVLFALVWVLMDRRFWTLLWYFYKSIMRSITRIFIEIDPIGILRNYVDDLKSSAANMDRQIANLRGQMTKLHELIKRNETERKNNLEMARLAKQEQKDSLFVLKARKAGRLQETNMTLNELYRKLEMLYGILKKMYETSLVLIEDIDDEVRVKSQEHDAIKASYSAFRSAIKVISGDEKKELFDQTMEYLADDYGKKLGEIQHFMDISANIINSIDLQNGVYESEALRQLEEWEAKSESVLFGDKQKLMAEASKEVLQLPSDKSIPQAVDAVVEETENKYGKLFEKEEKKDG